MTLSAYILVHIEDDNLLLLTFISLAQVAEVCVVGLKFPTPLMTHVGVIMMTHVGISVSLSLSVCFFKMPRFVVNKAGDCRKRKYGFMVKEVECYSGEFDSFPDSATGVLMRCWAVHLNQTFHTWSLIVFWVPDLRP